MPSYVLTNKGEVIYLNTDMPLAAGDDQNFQFSPSNLPVPLQNAFAGTGQNFFVNDSVAAELRSLPPYATGAADVGGALAAPLAVSGFQSLAELGGAMQQRMATLNQIDLMIFGGDGQLGHIALKSGWHGYEGSDIEIRGATYQELPRIELK